MSELLDQMLPGYVDSFHSKYVSDRIPRRVLGVDVAPVADSQVPPLFLSPPSGGTASQEGGLGGGRWAAFGLGGHGGFGGGGGGAAEGADFRSLSAPKPRVKPLTRSESPLGEASGSVGYPGVHPFIAPISP